MIIAQLSDPHVTVRQSEFHDLYLTIDKLQRAIDRVNAMEPRPKFAVITGDLVNEGGADEYDALSAVLATLEIPAYLGIGNHDCRETFRQKFADHAYVPKTDYIQYCWEEEGLRHVMLDTNVKGQAWGRLCEERLAWLDKTLSEKPTMPTLIFMHHPPFLTGIKPMDEMGLKDADKFGEVISRHKQVLRIFCGHLHRTISSNFYGVHAEICASTSHKVMLNLTGSERLGTVDEPADILLHLWTKDHSLVSHVCFTEEAQILWELEGYPE
ncbi:phosphodiesterase [Sneathiella glossodoripedis]|uniref:phosphodiesterase n=1 Tax=Sneathiella glossodoripedis TaxID=418853 RepID=UPI000470656E|nr:phosphodiesterase [Sneathiella glossodoripedis]